MAGGTGSRLHPCTLVTNKHLLPVYNKPMIFHPLEILRGMGINDILIVTGGESMGDFMKLLGSGEMFGVKLTYRIQDKPLGIAHALLLAEDFARGEKTVVILGDNIFEKVKIDPNLIKDDENAVVFLKEVDDAERFGVVVFDEGGNVIEIEEKPKVPKSNYAVTGMYVYPPDVFTFIKALNPSDRGELEITDVNNAYIRKGRIEYDLLEGWWADCGTFDSLLRANNLMAKKQSE